MKNKFYTLLNLGLNQSDYYEIFGVFSKESDAEEFCLEIAETINEGDRLTRDDFTGGPTENHCKSLAVKFFKGVTVFFILTYTMKEVQLKLMQNALCELNALQKLGIKVESAVTELEKEV